MSVAERTQDFLVQTDRYLFIIRFHLRIAGHAKSTPKSNSIHHRDSTRRGSHRSAHGPKGQENIAQALAWEFRPDKKALEGREMLCASPVAEQLIANHP
jgi:hypothetical protein